MIDYREVLVTYIKDKLSDIDVYNAAKSFKEPTDNYATFYIINESVFSFLNSSVTDSDNDEVTYNPLTVVEVRLSVRGSNSFSNCKTLWNSLDIINNKISLNESGVCFMGKSSITQLPTMKNTRNQEGYLFTITFSYDNSFTNTEILAEEINADGN